MCNSYLSCNRLKCNSIHLHWSKLSDMINHNSFLDNWFWLYQFGCDQSPCFVIPTLAGTCHTDLLPCWLNTWPHLTHWGANIFQKKNNDVLRTLLSLMKPVDYSATSYIYFRGCHLPVLTVFIFYFDIHWFIDQYVCLAWQSTQITQSNQRNAVFYSLWSWNVAVGSSMVNFANSLLLDVTVLLPMISIKLNVYVYDILNVHAGSCYKPSV